MSFVFSGWSRILPQGRENTMIPSGYPYKLQGVLRPSICKRLQELLRKSQGTWWQSSHHVHPPWRQPGHFSSIHMGNAASTSKGRGGKPRSGGNHPRLQWETPPSSKSSASSEFLQICKELDFNPNFCFDPTSSHSSLKDLQVLLAMPCGMWDLSSLTKDWTCAPGNGQVECLNY